MLANEFGVQRAILQNEDTRWLKFDVRLIHDLYSPAAAR
jgi:hypothetical protein